VASSDFLTELDSLESRLQNESRPRVSRALQEIVVDCLCPKAGAKLSPAEQKWLLDAVSVPVSDGTHAALQALLLGLSRMVDSAPPSLVAKLDVFAASQSESGSD
jgi:hypothetical protein